MLRAGAAIHADNVDRKRFQRGHGGTDLGPVKHRPKDLDRHLSDHRYLYLLLLKKLEDGSQGRLCLQQVLTRLDNKQIAAAVVKPPDLFSISVLQSGVSNMPQRW